jgi:glyoxylate reductase
VRATVLIAHRLPAAGLELLAPHCEVRRGGGAETPAKLRELARGVEAIVADPSVVVDETLLEAAGPRLAIVANFAVGHDNVDLKACADRGVAVSNTPDVLTDATAELALGLTLAAARRIPSAERELRAGEWTGFDPEGHLGQELSGATFGIVGLGRIGRRYAELVAALAGRIVYASPTRKEEAERELEAERAQLDQLLGEADVVSLHAPWTAETTGLIDAAALGSMKPDAILVNTARGPLLDAAALAAALERGEIGAAGLDVYPNEPEVPAELLAAPRCVLLPHIGSATRRARDAMAVLVAENTLAALRGEEPPNRVV